MELTDYLIVVLLAFLSGMGSNVAKEVFDWMKEKRKTILKKDKELEDDAGRCIST